MSVKDLLSLQSKAIFELHSRNVLRTQNNPTGDYAEWLVSKRMSLKLEMNSSRGFDAVCSGGLKYQIKGRRITPSNLSTQSSVIRSIELKEFDFLIGVVFDSEWAVIRAMKIPYETVKLIAKPRPRQNGHVLFLNASLLSHPNIEDITHTLQE